MTQSRHSAEKSFGVTKLRDIPWPRILSEGAVIVASILVAFWIDAWWDGRQDREDESAILEVLLTEFQQIKESIDDIQDYHVAILASTYQLVGLAEHPDPDISDHEINLLLEDQTWFSSPDSFSAPKLNAIIDRGDISLISNRVLRARLTLLPDKLTWIRTALREDVVFTGMRLEPFLARNASLLHIQNAGQTRPGTSGFEFPALPIQTGTAFSHKSLLKNREFQNLMIQRSTILEDIISLARTPDLLKRLEETIELIERELN